MLNLSNYFFFNKQLHLTDVTVEIIIRVNKLTFILNHSSLNLNNFSKDNQNNVFTGKYTTFDQNSYQTDMNLISSNPVQPDQTKNVGVF